MEHEPVKKEQEIEELLKEYRVKYREKVPKALAENIQELSWETIANLAETFRIRILKNTAELRKVQKELELTKMILIEKLRSAGKGKTVLDAAFMKHLIDLMERAYKLSIQYEIDADSFMVLIALILEKLKKEKLIVYDPKGRSFVSFRKIKPEIREDVFAKPMEENLKHKGTKKGGPNVKQTNRKPKPKKK